MAPFSGFVTILSARLLIEVLMRFVPAVAPRIGSPRYPETLGQEFMAFIDLRPFFTRWWLRVLWWLYLLDALRVAYGNIAFNVPPPHVVDPVRAWAWFLEGFLGLAAYTGGLRLSIEVATRFAPEAETTPATTRSADQQASP
jgi:hypothetical protein